MSLDVDIVLQNSSTVDTLTMTVYAGEIMCGQSRIWCGETRMSFAIPDEGAYNLILELQGKEPGHTKLNDQNQIIDDVLVSISSIQVENIDINQILIDKAVYQHNFNSTGPLTLDKYNGVLGCNGQVSIPFNGIFHVWLLENL